MSPLLVASCYGSAAAVALLLLWYLGVKHWWWHAGSVVLAIGIGSIPLTEPFNQPAWTLAIGWVFVFLMMWGVAAPVVAAVRHPGWLHLRRH